MIFCMKRSDFWMIICTCVTWTILYLIFLVLIFFISRIFHARQKIYILPNVFETWNVKIGRIDVMDLFITHCSIDSHLCSSCSLEWHKRCNLQRFTIQLTKLHQSFLRRIKLRLSQNCKRAYRYCWFLSLSTWHHLGCIKN